MDTLFYRMITNGLIVIALLPAVWLLCRAFRKQPATQNLLWLLLLAKLTLAPILIWSFSFETELIDFLAKREPVAVVPADSTLSTQSAANGNPKASVKEVADSPVIAEPQSEPIALAVPESIENQAASEPDVQESNAQPLPQNKESLANEEPNALDVPITSDPATPEPVEEKIVAASAISPSASANVSQKETVIPLIAKILKVVRSPEVIWYGSIIWLVGCLAFGLNVAQKLLATRNLIKNSLPCSTELAQIAQNVAEQFRIKQIEVREVVQLDSPCVVAFGRAKILWPSEMNPTAQGCRAIMAHEIVHIKRRDHWAMWLEMIAGVIWWWNPACYFIRRRLHETRELACDAVALAQLGEEPADYAQKLIDLTTGQSFRASRHLPACSVGAVSKNSLQRRLVMLFEDRIVGRTSRLGLLAGLLVAALVVPTFVLGEPKEPEKKQETAEQKIADSKTNELVGNNNAESNTLSSTADSSEEESIVEATVTELMKALIKGDSKKAESYLIPNALRELALAKVPLISSTTGKMQFKIIAKQLQQEKEKQIAIVKCEITDINSSQREIKYSHKWVLRKESDGWKVVGMELDLWPGVHFDFEDGQAMKREVDKRNLQSPYATANPNTIQPFDTFKMEYAIGDFPVSKTDYRVSSNGLMYVHANVQGDLWKPVAVKIVGLSIEEAEKKIKNSIIEKSPKQRNHDEKSVAVQITDLHHDSNRLAEFEKNRKAVIQNGDEIVIENENGAGAPKGRFTVEEEGTLALGARFGRVSVAGRTVVEATEILFEHLSKKNKNLDATFSLRYFKKPPPITDLRYPSQPLNSPIPSPSKRSETSGTNSQSLLNQPQAAPNSLARSSSAQPQKRYEFQITFFSGDPNGTVKDGTIKVIEVPKFKADSNLTVYCHDGSDPRSINQVVLETPALTGSTFYMATGKTIVVRTIAGDLGKINLHIQAVFIKSSEVKDGQMRLVSSSNVNVATAKFGEITSIQFPTDSKTVKFDGTIESHWAEIIVTEAPADVKAASVSESDARALTDKSARNPQVTFKDTASHSINTGVRSVTKEQSEKEWWRKQAEANSIASADKIQPGDKLNIQSSGGYTDDLIEGDFLVEPSGSVALGPRYGRVKVKALTIEEAEKAVEAALGKVIRDGKVQITMDYSARQSRALLLERSSNLVRFATLSSEVYKKKLEKLLEANKAAPNSVSPIEIEETRLMVERSLLEARQAQIENELIKLGKDVSSSDAKNLHPTEAKATFKYDPTSEKIANELKEASFRVEEAQLKLVRLKKLLEEKKISAEEAERAKIEYDKAVAEVRRLDSNLVESVKRQITKERAAELKKSAPQPGQGEGY